MIQQQHQQQLRSLQYIRGLAMALVVAAHVQSMWKALSPGEYRIHHAMLVFLHGGAIGVFFVVAGFLFHHQQLERQQQHEQQQYTDDASCLETAIISSPTRTTEKVEQRLSSKRWYPPSPVCLVRIQRKPKDEQSLAQFDSIRYIKRRFRKIGVPYILTSVPVLLRRIFLEERRTVNLTDHFPLDHNDAQRLAMLWRKTLSPHNLWRVLSLLCNGHNVIYAYWFIPVMLGMSCLSPFVVMFIQWSRITQTCVLVFLYGLALVVVGRPTADTKPHTWQMVLYFWPVYLTGTLLSVHRKRLLMETRCAWTSFGIILVLMGQIEFGSEVAGHAPFVANGFGLLQLLLTCWWSFAVTQTYNTRCFRPLVLHHLTQGLADASLDVYLWHPWLLYFFDGLLEDWGVKQNLIHKGWFVWVFETSVVLFVCVGMSLVWRWVLGKFRFQRWSA